jgi:EAL domain-containing protein (putative c-di-GMP-specific phosphodiesterase class I)
MHAFSMAFQPIVDLTRGEIFAYEALVRPPPRHGQGQGCAADVLQQVTAGALPEFDEACREQALATAGRLGLGGFLALNFMPHVLPDSRASLLRSLAVAERQRIAPHRLILEVPGVACSADGARLRGILADFRSLGVITAIDDFGAAHGGLHLLADCQPDIVKIDMALTRGIHRDRARRAIVRAVTAMCADLGISLVAEGVEEVDEAYELRELDVRLFQGYLFGRPSVGMLPQPNLAVMDQLTGQHAALRLLEPERA